MYIFISEALEGIHIKYTSKGLFNLALRTYSSINSILQTSEEEEWQRYDAGCQLPV